MTDVPVATCSRTSRKNRATASLLSGAVGSSRMSSVGATAKALAISSRCRCATVRVSTRSRGSTSRPTCASSRRATSGRDPVRKTSAGSATSRFSCTVRSGSTAGCWWTIAMPRAAASRGVSEATVCPPTVIVPVSGTIVPDAMFISVDLPAPFSPRIACTSPESTLTDTSVSAATPPKCLAMPAISSVAGRVAVIVDPVIGSSSGAGLTVSRRAPAGPDRSGPAGAVPAASSVTCRAGPAGRRASARTGTRHRAGSTGS